MRFSDCKTMVIYGKEKIKYQFVIVAEKSAGFAFAGSLFVYKFPEPLEVAGGKLVRSQKFFKKTSKKVPNFSEMGDAALTGCDIINSKLVFLRPNDDYTRRCYPNGLYK